MSYPCDAEPAFGFVSVPSPVGASLIGRRVGSIARWRMPGGGHGEAEVVALLFQPETSGDYTMQRRTARACPPFIDSTTTRRSAPERLPSLAGATTHVNNTPCRAQFLRRFP